jgi:hypothetical protein
MAEPAGWSTPCEYPSCKALAFGGQVTRPQQSGGVLCLMHQHIRTSSPPTGRRPSNSHPPEGLDPEAGQRKACEPPAAVVLQHSLYKACHGHVLGRCTVPLAARTMRLAVSSQVGGWEVCMLTGTRYPVHPGQLPVCGPHRATAGPCGVLQRQHHMDGVGLLLPRTLLSVGQRRTCPPKPSSCPLRQRPGVGSVAWSQGWQCLP